MRTNGRYPKFVLSVGFLVACGAPYCVPELVGGFSETRLDSGETRKLSASFIPSLVVHHNGVPALCQPSAARLASLAPFLASEKLADGRSRSGLRSRLARHLSDNNKQDQSQEDKSQEDVAQDEDTEVFWMFEQEKNFREELKAPTLLRVELDNYDVQGLVKWAQSYPYAAVLPVQPLMVEPKENGIDVLFRKKPTQERGSIDGGLRVTVEEVTSITWDPHRWPQASRNKEADVYTEAVGAEGTGRQGGAEKSDPQRCTVMITRIAEGQMVEKKFSEKLVVQRMLKEMRSAEFKHGRVISACANDLSMPKGPKFPDPK